MGDGETATTANVWDTATALYAAHENTMIELELQRAEKRPPDADGVISWLIVVKCQVWLNDGNGSARTFGVNTNGDDLHAGILEAEEAALDKALSLLGIELIDGASPVEIAKKAVDRAEAAVRHASDAMRANPPFGAKAPPVVEHDEPFVPGTYDANGRPLRPQRPAAEASPSSATMDPAELKRDIVKRCAALGINIAGKTAAQVAEMLTKMHGAKVKHAKDGSITMAAVRDGLLTLPQAAPADEPLPEDFGGLPNPENMTLEEAMS